MLHSNRHPPPIFVIPGSTEKARFGYFIFIEPVAGEDTDADAEEDDDDEKD
jgi:hypothetical protein